MATRRTGRIITRLDQIKQSCHRLEHIVAVFSIGAMVGSVEHVNAAALKTGSGLLIVIEPIGGLSNRMRAIDSAVALGQLLQRPVSLVWTANARAGCRFDDIFEKPDELANVRERDGFSGLNIDWPKVKSFISLRSPPSTMCQSDVEKWLRPGADVSWMTARPTLHFKTHWRMLNLYNSKRLFKPLPGLQDRINSMLPQARQCVGVHIRRGDHLPSRRYSTSTLFERRLDHELEKDPGVRFLLVTDDAGEEARFKQSYGEAIILTHKTSCDRACKIAIEDAVVDLFTLALTKRILGSAASSFSVMASDLFGAPLDVVSEQLPDRLDW